MSVRKWLATVTIGLAVAAPSYTMSRAADETSKANEPAVTAAKAPAESQPATTEAKVSTTSQPAATEVKAPATSEPAVTMELKTLEDKIGYSYGTEIARGLLKSGVKLNVDAMAQGMKDVAAGRKLLLTPDELRAHVAAVQTIARSKQAEARVVAQENKRKGDAFLAENKTKEGVVTLPSGLQYKILKAGNSNNRKPVDTDMVEVNYRGMLLDGTEFDRSGIDTSPFGGSANAKEPPAVKVSDVIAGWNEALKLMPVGSKWQLFIPGDLAYGRNGWGTFVGPNATVIYELELLGIRKPE